MNEDLGLFKFWVDLGLNSSLSVLIIYFIFKYAPEIIKTHIEFVSSSKKQGEEIAQCLDTHVVETKNTVAAMRRGCDILEIFAKGTAFENDVRFHVQDIRKLLDV